MPDMSAVVMQRASMRDNIYLMFPLSLTTHTLTQLSGSLEWRSKQIERERGSWRRTWSSFAVHLLVCVGACNNLMCKYIWIVNVGVAHAICYMPLKKAHRESASWRGERQAANGKWQKICLQLLDEVLPSCFYCLNSFIWLHANNCQRAARRRHVHLTVGQDKARRQPHTHTRIDEMPASPKSQ